MIKKVKNIGMYAFLILVTFISVFPLYWMVSASTNKSVDVSKGVLSLGSHLGENLKNLLANQDVGAALVNSFKYAILLTIVSMVICSLAGYGFEIYHDKAKDAVMGVILLAMMVPFITILVPLFQMVAKMKMLNSTLGFILPTVSTPFLIMMFRQSARSFPRDIIEAFQKSVCSIDHSDHIFVGWIYDSAIHTCIHGKNHKCLIDIFSYRQTK